MTFPSPSSFVLAPCPTDRLECLLAPYPVDPYAIDSERGRMEIYAPSPATLCHHLPSSSFGALDGVLFVTNARLFSDLAGAHNLPALSRKLGTGQRGRLDTLEYAFEVGTHVVVVEVRNLMANRWSLLGPDLPHSRSHLKWETTIAPVHLPFFFDTLCHTLTGQGLPEVALGVTPQTQEVLAARQQQGLQQGLEKAPVVSARAGPRL
jgi:hypothetical protein